MADVLTEDGFESLDKTVGCSILITHPPVWIETSKGERYCSRTGKFKFFLSQMSWVRE